VSRDVVCDAVPARNIPHRPRQHQPYAHFFPKELDTGVAAARRSSGLAREAAGNMPLTCPDCRITRPTGSLGLPGDPGLPDHPGLPDLAGRRCRIWPGSRAGRPAGAMVAEMAAAPSAWTPATCPEDHLPVPRHPGPARRRRARG
jgi:hypothetical protein